MTDKEKRTCIIERYNLISVRKKRSNPAKNMFVKVEVTEIEEKTLMGKSIKDFGEID